MTPGVNRLRAANLFWPCRDNGPILGWHWQLAVIDPLIYPHENRGSVPRMVYTSKARLHSTFISDLHLMTTPPRDSAVTRLRWDLVVRVRREIQAGTYETNEKWEIALSRLQDELERLACTEEEEFSW